MAILLLYLIRWIIRQHLSVLISLQAHRMGTPLCWFKVYSWSLYMWICSVDRICYLDLVLFIMDKMMEGEWIQRDWDVVWALDFQISRLMLSLDSVWPWCLFAYFLVKICLGPASTECAIFITIEFTIVVVRRKWFQD
jgi:hypothetical protein